MINDLPELGSAEFDLVTGKAAQKAQREQAQIMLERLKGDWGEEIQSAANRDLHRRALRAAGFVPKGNDLGRIDPSGSEASLLNIIGEQGGQRYVDKAISYAKKRIAIHEIRNSTS